MGKITFILGGARSGKSQYAVKLAKEKAKRVAFVATCSAQDEEMKERIRQHKKSRPKTWQAFEEPEGLLALLKKIGLKFEVVIIDCLGLWLSNLLLRGRKKNEIENKIYKILAYLKKINANSIIVSNEVGQGIVPENKLARDFRDLVGRINQITAEKSTQVFFMVSGIPWRIK